MKRFRKNMMFLTVFLLMGLSVLAGCSAKTLPLQEGEQAFQVYYLNSAMTRLVPQEYRTRTADTDELIDELMQCFLHVPDDLDSQTALSDKVAYQGYKRMDNVLYLFFDRNYTSMQAEREILCRAALVRTLTQIPGVEYVSVYTGDLPLLGTNGAPVGMMAAGDFVDSISDVNAYEMTELTLYFTDQSGEKLYPEKRMVIHNINTSVEKLVVEELIKGPEREGLMPTLDAGTRLLNASVNENVCYLNFDASFLNNSLEVRDYIPIYSIVNSISELSGMNRVQISVNGEKEMMFRESISLNGMFERNLDYIGGMEY